MIGVGTETHITRDKKRRKHPTNHTYRLDSRVVVGRGVRSAGILYNEGGVTEEEVNDMLNIIIIRMVYLELALFRHAKHKNCLKTNGNKRRQDRLNVIHTKPTPDL